MFEHLFWFLGHPEVYIVLLPALGITSEIISTSSMPLLQGLTAKDAVFICEQMGLQVSINGSGKIVQQSILPNTRINTGEKIVLTLK